MNVDILLAGVGGQGTVLASRVLAEAAIWQGAFVRTAETIGMAQRGGSVVSHVRIGDTASSMIPVGHADALIASEPGEACRTLPYLKEDGLLVVADAGVPAVVSEVIGARYDPAIMLAYLRKTVKRLRVIPVAGVQSACATSKALNIALIGAAVRAGLGDLTTDGIRAAITRLVKPRYVPMNESALLWGANYEEE